MAAWRLVEARPPSPSRWAWRSLAVFGVGLVLTGGVAAAAWAAMRPDTVVQTRILVDGGAARPALSDIALRLVGTAGQPVSLQEGGRALVVSVQDRDPMRAQQRSQALVDAILDAPVAAPAADASPAPASPAVALRAERDRVTAAIAGLDAQGPVASASLTALARDIAAASRPADQKPGHETLDKGNAALADLQLQRLQLVAKYQDTYPAVVALDGQIRNLHVFLMDEAQRIQARPDQSGPALAVLNAERDRLRAESAERDERRRTLVGQLAALDTRLATLPLTAPALASAVTSAPVLVAAATSNLNGVDSRPVTAQIVAAIGLALSALAALLVGRRHAPLSLQGLMLQPITPGMLAAAPFRPLPPPGFPAMADSGATQMMPPLDWDRRRR